MMCPGEGPSWRRLRRRVRRRRGEGRGGHDNRL